MAGIACAVTGIAAALAIGIILDYTGDPDFAGGDRWRPFERDYYVWMPAGPIHTVVNGVRDFTVPFGFLIDPLSCVMLFVVTFVGFLIHVYSVGYMPRGVQRYFTYLKLSWAPCCCSSGNNYAVMFVGGRGWALLLLLIGFYFRRSSRPTPAGSVHLNRIGDFASSSRVRADLDLRHGSTRAVPVHRENQPLMEGAS